MAGNWLLWCLIIFFERHALSAPVALIERANKAGMRINYLPAKQLRWCLSIFFNRRENFRSNNMLKQQVLVWRDRERSVLVLMERTLTEKILAHRLEHHL